MCACNGAAVRTREYVSLRMCVGVYVYRYVYRYVSVGV